MERGGTRSMTMGFGQAIATCMTNYATFSGRASRSEFWWFYLFVVLMSWGATLVAAAALPAEPAAADALSGLVNLMFLLPVLAAGARRLHDIGRSGWWQLLYLTGIGVILLIVWWVLNSKQERNAHGTPAAAAGI